MPDKEVQKWNREMFEEMHGPVQENMYEVMEYTEYTLGIAKEYKMEIEVVVWALKYMKDDPSLSIKQAIAYSFNDWIK